MKQKQSIYTAILLILLVGTLIYLPYVPKLGLYRDDWNNIYNAAKYGSGKMVEHYASDRPADGLLIGWFWDLFDRNFTAYHAVNFLCRLFSAVFVFLTAARIWPKALIPCALFGILSVLFPGFMQQVNNLSYIPHQVAMLAFCLSLWLTAVALDTEKRPLKILLTVFAVVLSSVTAILMEYYIGMEAIRFGLIFLIEERKNRKRAFERSVIRYLPYIAAMLIFVIWRSFFFDAERNGTDVMSQVIAPLLAHPKSAGMSLLLRILKSEWKLFVGVWTIPLYNQLNGIDFKSFAAISLPAIACLLLSAAGIRCLREEENENYAREWILLGLFSGSFAILPLVLAGRDVNFASSLDRFSWPGAFGTTLFILGAIRAFPSQMGRKLLYGSLILASAYVQLQNGNTYVHIFNEQKAFWQQVLWRIPGLAPDTTLVIADSAFPVEEDYEIFAPAALIYYPQRKTQSPIGAETLSRRTVHDIEMQKSEGRESRTIYIGKDYTKLLALTKPNAKSCVQVIDGANPIYSPHEWSEIPNAGRYSRPELIVMEPDHTAYQPLYIPVELEHGWCYYYEKIALAMQQEDPEKAAALADEAIAAGFWAEDYVEWIPVIEAYAETGHAEKAERFMAILKEDAYLGRSACTYFENKTNKAAYREIVEWLCR